MRSLGFFGLTAVAVLGLAVAANATAIHPNVITTKWSFTGIQETSNAGDPEPLWGAPIASGDVLLFSPPAFTAQANNGGFADTGSQLQMMIKGNSPTDIIDKITIQEFGDAVFVGAGTAATGGFINMAGFITVLEVSGIAVAPTVIGFIGTFTVGPSFSLPANPGTTLWKGTGFIDVAALVANATKVMVSLDNDLYVYTEAGTFAKIQKKVTNGVVITVPEPGTLALFGLVCLGVRLRVRRS